LPRHIVTGKHNCQNVMKIHKCTFLFCSSTLQENMHVAHQEVDRSSTMDQTRCWAERSRRGNVLRYCPNQTKARCPVRAAAAALSSLPVGCGCRCRAAWWMWHTKKRKGKVVRSAAPACKPPADRPCNWCMRSFGCIRVCQPSQ
jgi:hypothetical protein